LKLRLVDFISKLRPNFCHSVVINIKLIHALLDCAAGATGALVLFGLKRQIILISWTAIRSLNNGCSGVAKIFIIQIHQRR